MDINGQGNIGNLCKLGLGLMQNNDGIMPPGGGGSKPKSVVACSKMKIRKDPYCVEFHLGFTPHSTQCWVTPHNFYVNGVTEKAPIPHNCESSVIRVTDKAPIPHNTSTFCKYCCPIWTFFVRKHPIPHTFCVILIFIPIAHPLLQI